MHLTCVLYLYFTALDVHLIDQQAMYAKRTGMIILGGGLVKHHVCNANMMVTVQGVDDFYSCTSFP